MNIHFILVEPATPGNIGAAARAIKTMGFNSLRLVRPGDHLDDEARKFAYASHDVLESAQLFDSLKEAVDGVDFTIAATAKDHTVWYDYFSPTDCVKLVKGKGESLNSVGIVFGREEHGLLKEELELCDLRSKIPMINRYPSINLGQCVMLYAYEFSALILPEEKRISKSPTNTEQKIMKKHAEHMLELLEIKRNPNLYRRMMERLMQVNEDDLHLLLSFHKHLTRKISNKN